MVHKNAVNGELIMSAVGELHRSVSGEASKPDEEVKESQPWSGV